MAKPSLNVDQAADQLTRSVQNYIPGWIPNFGTPITLSYGFRAFAPDGNPSYDNYPNAQLRAM
jgi:hypothetical protein